VARLSTSLVVTPSSETPPPDEIRTRWRRRPVLAFVVRAVAVAAPLTASVLVGIVASRQFRPHGWPATIAWAVWTASASLLALWVVDVAARRLLPLHRLLQLCLAFPDRAPSRVRVAVRAARSHRPEALVGRVDVPRSATVAAEQVVTMLGALAMHDRRTRGHCERVCAFTEMLAEQMHLSADERDRLAWVALVHDIGKLHVSPKLLNKPGRPTVSEWRLLKTHPERGAAITEPLRDWLGPAADAVLEHHERFDGQGYPHGLAGDEISPAARIIAVTDAFEVMTAPRAYRRPVDAQTARAELARHAGSQFDPTVVRSFLAIGLPKLRRAMGPLAWLAEIPFVSSWPRLEAAASTTASHAAAATAAASTAGLLALVSGGGTTVAEASAVPNSGHASGDGVPASVVLVPNAVSAPEVTELPAHTHAASSVGTHVHVEQSSVASHHATVNTRATSRRAFSRKVSPAQPRQSHHHVTSTDASTDSAAASPAPTEAHGHAYGHEHAPGWQKNWGDGGRQVHRHHGKD